MRIPKLLPIIFMVAALLITLLPASYVSAETSRLGFSKIAGEGNGDAMNNYAWAMCEFNGALYVGTGRNIPYQAELGLKMELNLPDAIQLAAITHPRVPVGSWEWAYDMCGEIWRYKNNQWEMVYRSVPVQIINPLTQQIVWTAREFGFREMIVYNGFLYATNGAQVVGYSQTGSLMLRSPSGNAGTWEKVDIGGSTAWDSRCLAVHNGKLYVGLSTIIGFGDKAEVWSTSDPSNAGSWAMVADLTSFGNQAVATLTSFNGFLYAGTVNEMGYQIWRSTVANPASNADWQMIVENGAGDMTNLFAGTMKVFNGQLYVGSMSIPLPTGDTIRLPKGFELIRINPDNSWELLIGDPVAQNPPTSPPPLRTPSSGWPGGFANPLNFYCWSMEEIDGELYLGTFDASILVIEAIRLGVGIENLTPEQQQGIILALQGLIGSLVGDMGFGEIVIDPNIPFEQIIMTAFQRLNGYLAGMGLEELEIDQSIPFDWERLLSIFSEMSGGGDIWKSANGVKWTPVTLNGLGNPHNYGIREMLNTGSPTYIGTSNPFEGFEVYTTYTRILRMGVGGEVSPINKTGLLAPWLAMAAVITAGGVYVIRRRVHRQAR